MPDPRLKVLLSAYACQPGIGSESGVGWNWALQIARFHDVTVLTRTRNRSSIEEGLRSLPPTTPTPAFVYFEASPWLRTAKRVLPGSSWGYYVAWQNQAHREVARLLQQQRYDLLQHLTWTSYRTIPAVWGQGVPVVWGPINGVEATPWQLLPWRYPRALLHEVGRKVSNGLATARLPRAAARSRAILASTRETLEALAESGVATFAVSENGIHRTPCPSRRHAGPTPRLLFVGRLVFYKGAHLALHALKASASKAQFTVMGEGDFRPALQRLCRQLGLASQVHFHSNIPREQLLERYREFDVLLFPSLHDSVPTVVLEAMASGLPVICLDCGGPGQVVTEGCGFKIRVGDFRQVVRELAQAITCYDQRRDLIPVHGQKAWERVMEAYHWDRLGERMHSIYQQVVTSP